MRTTTYDKARERANLNYPEIATAATKREFRFATKVSMKPGNGSRGTKGGDLQHSLVHTTTLKESRLKAQKPPQSSPAIRACLLKNMPRKRRYMDQTVGSFIKTMNLRYPGTLLLLSSILVMLHTCCSQPSQRLHVPSYGVSPCLR